MIVFSAATTCHCRRRSVLLCRRFDGSRTGGHDSACREVELAAQRSGAGGPQLLARHAAAAAHRRLVSNAHRQRADPFSASPPPCSKHVFRRLPPPCLHCLRHPHYIACSHLVNMRFWPYSGSPLPPGCTPNPPNATRSSRFMSGICQCGVACWHVCIRLTSQGAA